MLMLDGINPIVVSSEATLPDVTFDRIRSNCVSIRCNLLPSNSDIDRTEQARSLQQMSGLDHAYFIRVGSAYPHHTTFE